MSGILKDPIGFIRKTMAEQGSPIDTIMVRQNVAVQKGQSLTGIAYFVSGRGQYDTEEQGRSCMQEGDRLYRIDVIRIE